MLSFQLVSTFGYSKERYSKPIYVVQLRPNIKIGHHTPGTLKVAWYDVASLLSFGSADFCVAKISRRTSRTLDLILVMVCIWLAIHEQSVAFPCVLLTTYCFRS